ncbi:MAG TPA: MFS transporter [Hyphomicrobiaceae bacterium]|nr:MFS transporter [Hyphomicrobiaceae bacterium]
METRSPGHGRGGYRWLQLVVGIICMVMIANLQYGWTFFVPDIQKTFQWQRAEIQIAFTLFVLFETWLVPIEGWFVDKWGPKLVILFGGILAGLGWIMNSYATTLGGPTGYYAAQIVAGIGAGGVYGTCIGNALKWFPDKRGLAAGLTAAGFGAGSALTVAPIQNMIAGKPLLDFSLFGVPVFFQTAAKGFQETFFWFGTWQGVVIVLLALLLRAPRSGEVPDVVRAAIAQSRRQYTPTELIGPTSYWLIGSLVALVGGLAMWAAGLQFYIPLALAVFIFIAGGSVVIAKGEPIFTLMYLMFVLVGAGGLMVTANLAPIAKDIKVDAIPVTILGLTLPALTFAATLDRILNGLTRPFFGWISDQIGREPTMFIAFGMEGVGIYYLYLWGHDPFWFVLLSGAVFFAWGEIYSLFPATATDTFGAKFATTNAGLLYTAKGTAALLVPYSNQLQQITGSWGTVFIIAAAANIAAALLAIGVLRPWRNHVIRRVDEEVAAAEGRMAVAHAS